MSLDFICNQYFMYCSQSLRTGNVLLSSLFHPRRIALPGIITEDLKVIHIVFQSIDQDYFVVDIECIRKVNWDRDIVGGGQDTPSLCCNLVFPKGLE